MSTPQPQFEIGQKVTAISFTNCFGKPVPATPGLTVEHIRLVTPTANDDMNPYYRIKAVPASGFGYVEGAERFFEASL